MQQFFKRHLLNMLINSKEFTFSDNKSNPSPRRNLLKKHNLTFILLFFIFIPGSLFMYGLLFGMDKLHKKIRPEHKLVGLTTNLERPKFDITHLRSHDIQ